MKYRKKPIVIEAYLCLPAISDPPAWLADGFDSGVCTRANNGVYVKTNEGTMRADWGDYIIQGVQGELYPCKPDIFEATYDKIPELPEAPPIQLLRDDQLPPNSDDEVLFGLFILFGIFFCYALFAIALIIGS